MFLRSCPQGALPLRPDWSVMMQRPHPPSSEKTLGAHGSPGVLHGLRDRWSRFILPRLVSSTTSGLSPPLSCAFKLSLGGFCFGELLQIPWPGPGPGLPPHQLRLPCPATPSAWLLSSALPTTLHTRLLPTSSPLLKPFPGPGARFPPLHLLVSSPLLAQDKFHLPTAYPSCPTPAGLSLFLPPL